MTWDITIPQGTEAANRGDDRIRELKEDLQVALRGDDTEGVESIFPGADTANPVFRYRGLKGATGARPTAGQYGFFFDSTRNVLQRDNGSGWDDVATMIPAGTVMVFYQAAAPTGWTKVVTQNDKALRVVSGSGGVAGGTDSIASPPTHKHATASHILTEAQIPSHSHIYGKSAPSISVDSTGSTRLALFTADSSGSATTVTGGGTGHDHGDVTDVVGFSPAYIDVILASKD